MVKLKIEYLPPGELKPYRKNARVHDADDVQALEDSIEEFDFSDPIGIWGPNNICSAAEANTAASICANGARNRAVWWSRVSAGSRCGDESSTTEQKQV